MAAEVTEIIERYRRGGSTEDLIAMITLMNVPIDQNSFVLGVMFGSRGEGSRHERHFDRLLPLLLLLANNANNPLQQQAPGGTALGSTQSLLPLLLLLDRDRDDYDKIIEIDKGTGTGESTGGRRPR